jgi:catechol 2,3-dioxygenase-like lactoylglutathione lyase family enzyme
VADVKTSATCYDAALGALGLRRVVEMPDKVGTDGVAYGKDHPLFWIDRFHPHGVKQHTAFRAASNADVDAFYATGLALVARITARPDCAQAKGYPPGYYAAFLLDPDGNNIEAVCRC